MEIVVKISTEIPCASTEMTISLPSLFLPVKEEVCLQGIKVHFDEAY